MPLRFWFLTGVTGLAFIVVNIGSSFLFSFWAKPGIVRAAAIIIANVFFIFMIVCYGYFLSLS